MATYQISVPEEKIEAVKKKLSRASFPDEVPPTIVSVGVCCAG